MRFARIIAVAGVWLISTVAAGNNDPARFWISASKDSPIVGEAPTINVAAGAQRTLYIWVQPATDSAGAFRTLQDFSLDVVTQAAAGQAEPQPIIDFVDGTFKVYNDPVIAGKKRFQYTTDSLRTEEQGGALLSDRLPAQVLPGQPDAIKGLQGLSLANDNVVGIGHINDPYRVVTGNGPAWRVAEFGVTALQESGTNSLFLQIGFSGMVYQGAGGTQALLGNNGAPIYDTTDANNQRQKNLAGDTFDIQLNATPFVPGDYNTNGVVGPEDYTYWRNSFGQSIVPGQGADGNGNGLVDAADFVFWRKKMSSGSASGSAFGMPAGASEQIAVPEPGTIALASIFVAVAPLLLTLRRE